MNKNLLGLLLLCIGLMAMGCSMSMPCSADDDCSIGPFGGGEKICNDALPPSNFCDVFDIFGDILPDMPIDICDFLDGLPGGGLSGTGSCIEPGNTGDPCAEDADCASADCDVVNEMCN